MELVDPRTDEDQLRACYALTVAGQPIDDPNVPPGSYRMFRSSLTSDDHPQQVWVARSQAGDLVGMYLLGLPERDNRTNAWLFPHVSPASRRQGIGTALLAHAAGQAAEAKRTLLMSNARRGAPGIGFAAVAGATAGLVEARRVLDADAALRRRLPGLRASAQPHAAGYTLRQWQGRTPDELVGHVVAVEAAMRDAPHEESFEPIRWDADRVRAADERKAARGTREYYVAALHDATGDMAALTHITVDPDGGGWAHQELTAVTRQHRGHRLGLLTKVAMLEWLTQAEPGVRHIITYNAAVNQHMISINEALGFRLTDEFQWFQLNVAAARALAPAGR